MYISYFSVYITFSHEIQTRATSTLYHFKKKNHILECGFYRGVLFLRIMGGKISLEGPYEIFVLEDPKRNKYSSICFYFFLYIKKSVGQLDKKAHKNIIDLKTKMYLPN